MKGFEELKTEIKLIDAFENEFGMMYQEMDTSLSDSIRVARHFYNIELLPIYVKVYNSIIEWIEGSVLKDFVCMPKLIDVGEDFIVRNWHVYHISIYRYFDNEEPVPAPTRFLEMKHVLLQLLNDVSPPQEKVLSSILKKNIIRAYR